MSGESAPDCRCHDDMVCGGCHATIVAGEVSGELTKVVAYIKAYEPSLRKLTASLALRATFDALERKEHRK